MRVLDMNFNEIINNNNLVLVDFYADWCGPCKMLAPIISEIKEELKDKVYVIKVNVDQEEELADKFGIYSIPTLVLIKDGKEIDRKTGYNTKQIITDWINRA
ncbi:MAG: thioredoxin [Bacilli bacterium]|nr:thioredoxin [Bacilli bacterium]